MKTVLITGANGEVGHGLIKKLQNVSTQADQGLKFNILALDINNLDSELIPNVKIFYKGSITDNNLVGKIFSDNKIDAVFHLAAILSTSGENNPLLAHEINVNGTLNLLEHSVNQHPLKFIFPSSIAVYGLPELSAKDGSSFKQKIKESEYLNPITMYGINKLYCENLGIYYSTYFGSVFSKHRSPNLDFRCVRFPGLISADTIPSGGTSDYASEMIHYAVQNKAYTCFVRPQSTIPFMAMPDAVNALLLLFKAAKDKLSQKIYNIRGFSPSAKEIETTVKKHFPNAEIYYKINKARQKIIDSWPKDIDDTKARQDWGFTEEYNFNKAFENYLIPSIKERYR